VTVAQPNQYQNPVTEEELTRIREMHAVGFSRNQIARELGRSNRTITIHANAMGLEFDRTGTEKATAARRADLAERRANIISDLYDIAEDEIAYLTSDAAYDLAEVSAGKAVHYTAKRLPAQDRKALVTAISTATSAAARLEAVDTNNGVDEGVSLLGQLATGLTAAYNAINEGAGDAP
jgi:hypothetical protein